jgi:hypothetical protein
LTIRTFKEAKHHTIITCYGIISLYEKLAAEYTDDFDREVFRVKRRSGITPERRRTEDATIPNFTENHKNIFVIACLCIYKLMSLLTIMFAL